MDYIKIFHSNSGGSVYLHPLHGADELSCNSEAAVVLADHGHVVELLPAIAVGDIRERTKWLFDVTGSKNPDVRIDRQYIGDIKTPNIFVAIKQSTINRCIYTCAQQKVLLAVINLVNRKYAVQDIKKGIIGALQPDRNKTIKEVWIITGKANLFKAKRAMVFDESFYDQPHLL